MKTKTSKEEQNLINKVTWNNIKHPKEVKEIKKEEKSNKLKKFLDGANEFTDKLFGEEPNKQNEKGIKPRDLNKEFFPGSTDEDPLGLNKMDLGF